LKKVVEFVWSFSHEVCKVDKLLDIFLSILIILYNIDVIY